jgi:hypothetical protein
LSYFVEDKDRELLIQEYNKKVQDMKRREEFE